MSPSDGQSIVEPLPRAACGEPDGAAVASQYGWVRSVARNLVRDPWGAEDVTQETLMAALARPPRDAEDARRLRAWLARVAFNLSRLRSRQGARRAARERRVARHEAVPSVCEQLETLARRRALQQAVAALPRAYREVIELRYFDGRNTADIAVQLGVSELAVRKRLWRARSKLRDALEHESTVDRLILALAPLMRLVPEGVRSAGRLQVVAGAAAGVSLCLGLAWWSQAESRAPVVLHGAPGVLVSSGPTLTPPQRPGAPLAPQPPSAPRGERRAAQPASGPGPTPEGEGKDHERGVETSTLPLAGSVRDLENRPRAGFEIFAPTKPAQVLATSDNLGSFTLESSAMPGRLEARSAGWATVVGAAPRAGEEATLLVAPAAPLHGRVADLDGRALPSARIELHCTERAFVRIDVPLRLESALLLAADGDAHGQFTLPALPRARGLVLRVTAPGHEALERESLELAREELFVLRAASSEALVAGTVFRQDGAVAVGAEVRLGLAHTTTDERGRYALPLRGAGPETPLEAHDKSAAPALVRGLGGRLAQGGKGAPQEVDLVLGDEHDPVDGKLVGEDAADWVVAAFRVGEAGGEPSALARSDEQGAFQLLLPRGGYDVYAIGPRTLRVLRGTLADSRAGRWSLALPPPTPPVQVAGLARAEDGELLAWAALEVRVRLDGDAGERTLPWRQLTADADGAFGFAAEAEASFELQLEHPSVAGRVSARPAGATPLELTFARRSYLRVEGAWADRMALRDGAGRLLEGRGPLAAASTFALTDGSSATLEIPATARWLELNGPGGASALVPIEPRAGELLRLRP